MFVAVELAGFALAEKEPVQKANFDIKFWLRIDIRMVRIIIIVSKDFTKLVTLNMSCPLLHTGLGTGFLLSARNWLKKMDTLNFELFTQVSK